jgi:DNA-binding NarL/FixJ family response regulator
VTTPAAIDVVLAEDNEVFREALELVLGGVADVRVVASVADGRSAVATCRELGPDVVVMDYRLPEMDGVEATAAIRSFSDAAVVALTATAESGEVDALLAAGAAACLRKDSDVNAIVAAIRDAAGRGATLL